jgi:CubicO group peptidase (beta-lactamase class C family)
MGLPPKSLAGQIGQGYAFGWVVGDDEGRKLIWHNGGVVGARTVNMTFPADGLDVVVFTNATTGEPETIALKIARLLYGG